MPDEQPAPDEAVADAPAEAPDKPLREMDKSELVVEAMAAPHKLPSFEAWAMTVDQLRTLLKES